MKLVLISSLLSLAYGFGNRSPICVEDQKQMEEGMGKSSVDAKQIFRVKASATSYTPGQDITVSLEGGKDFKGLLLYARSTSNEHVGKWKVEPGFQTLDSICEKWGKAGSTLSHSDSKAKPFSRNFTFTAPEPGVGRIQIRGIVVTESKSTWAFLKEAELSGPGKASDSAFAGGGAKKSEEEKKKNEGIGFKATLVPLFAILGINLML